MRYLLVLCTLALARPHAAPLAAQSPRNAAERAIDREQIQDGQEAIERDKEEIRRFWSLLAKYDDARTTERWDEARAVHADLVTAMSHEAEQAAARAIQAEREVRQGRGEIRADRREIREDRHEVVGTGREEDLRYLRRDRADRRDDRRDLRDDRRDRAGALARAEREAELAAEVQRRALATGQLTHGQLARDRVLFAEFHHLRVADYEANLRELREDRRERREDRREVRKDSHKRKPDHDASPP